MSTVPDERTPLTGSAPKVHSSRADNISLSVVFLNVVTLVGFTWFLVLSSDPSKLGWFALHPPLMTLAFAAFAWGIMTLQPTSLEHPEEKAAGFKRHRTIALLLGLPLALVGAVAMITNKFVHHAPHFTSWHGKLGLISLVWVLGQMSLGAAATWRGGVLLGGGDKAKGWYKHHRASGYVLIASMLATIHLSGAWSDWVVGHTSYASRVAVYMVAPALILVGIWSRARLDKMKLFTAS